MNLRRKRIRRWMEPGGKTYLPAINGLLFTYPLGWPIGNHSRGASLSFDGSVNCAC
jgi:hypothetical protein